MPARVMCVFECRYDSYKFHCACDECKVEASGKCNASGDLSTKRAFFAWDCSPCRTRTHAGPCARARFEGGLAWPALTPNATVAG